MVKIYATNTVVSKGFESTPALKFSENGESVRFRIGYKVYDPNAENKSRWVNISVKAFGPVCERIKKMQLKEGSLINFSGNLDEDVWTDQSTQTRKSAMVAILDGIEYAAISNGKSKENQNETTTKAPDNSISASENHTETDNFMGYESFGMGTANSFYG